VGKRRSLINDVFTEEWRGKVRGRAVRLERRDCARGLPAVEEMSVLVAKLEEMFKLEMKPQRNGEWGGENRGRPCAKFVEGIRDHLRGGRLRPGGCRGEEKTPPIIGRDIRGERFDVVLKVKSTLKT